MSHNIYRPTKERGEYIMTMRTFITYIGLNPKSKVQLRHNSKIIYAGQYGTFLKTEFDNVADYSVDKLEQESDGVFTFLVHTEE